MSVVWLVAAITAGIVALVGIVAALVTAVVILALSVNDWERGDR